jgi:hypothetical protein
MPVPIGELSVNGDFGNFARPGRSSDLELGEIVTLWELHSTFPPCRFKIVQAWLIARFEVSPAKSKSVLLFG